jgi:hypothetical protein
MPRAWILFHNIFNNLSCSEETKFYEKDKLFFFVAIFVPTVPSLFPLTPDSRVPEESHLQRATDRRRPVYSHC